MSVLRKIPLISLAALLVFGASNLAGGFPYRPAAGNQPASYVLAGYHPNRGFVIPQQNPRIKRQQGSGTTANLSANLQASENWAGYIAAPASSGTSYTSISGSWVVPNLTGGQQASSAAQWIGLGGVSVSDLLQIGTIEQFDESGQPSAEVFWEQLPASAQEIMSVPIGSTIKAGISESSASAADSGSTWDLTFSSTAPDGGTQNKTITVTLDSTYAQEIGSSAEWISEDPSNQYNQLYPLANMGTVNYTSATVNGQPLNSSANKVQPVALVAGNGSVLLAPSSIGADGESFATEPAGTSGANSNTNPNAGTTPGYRQSPFPGTQWHTRSSQGTGQKIGSRTGGWQWVIEISW